MAHNGGADSEQENAQRHMRKLSLVRIVSSNLNFGCMTGLLEGTDIPVTLALLTSRKQRLLGGWPRVGDIVGCEHVAHSVYEPRTLLLQEELQSMLLLRRCLPYDITEHFFGIRRPLMRVDNW
uniref:Uncharacterized protein n=1 Tax=Prymnesium polylepis TaxID=72548 RepID=A0A7S4M2J9_9EUKA